MGIFVNDIIVNDTRALWWKICVKLYILAIYGTVTSRTTTVTFTDICLYLFTLFYFVRKTRGIPGDDLVKRKEKREAVRPSIEKSGKF